MLLVELPLFQSFLASFYLSSRARSAQNRSYKCVRFFQSVAQTHVKVPIAQFFQVLTIQFQLFIKQVKIKEAIQSYIRFRIYRLGSLQINNINHIDQSVKLQVMRNNQDVENTSPNIIQLGSLESAARFNTAQMIANSTTNNVLSGGLIQKTTSPARTPDGVSPRFLGEAGPKLSVNPGVSNFDDISQKNINTQSSKPKTERADSKNHALKVCPQVSEIHQIKQSHFGGTDNSSRKADAVMNPETQNTIHNLAIGVKKEIPNKRDRGESEEADSLMCQEEYQAAVDDQDAKNEQNTSQPIVESLINSTKNIKANVQELREPLSNKVIHTANTLNLTKSKSVKNPANEKSITDNQNILPRIVSPFVNIKMELKMQVEAPVHFSGVKTKLNAPAEPLAGLSEPTVKFKHPPSGSTNFNRGLLMTNAAIQYPTIPAGFSYPMFPAQTAQSSINNWAQQITPQKKSTYRDSSTKQINFSDLRNLQATLSPRDPGPRYHRSSRKISNNFFHGDELMSSGHKSKNPGKSNRLLSRNPSPEKDGWSQNSKSVHSKMGMSSFGPASKNHGRNIFQDIIDRPSPIREQPSRNQQQVSTPKLLMTPSKGRYQSTRNPFDPKEPQRSFSPSPENQGATSIKINTPSAKKIVGNFVMNSVSIRKQNKSPILSTHRSACYKSPIITNQNNDTQEKYKTKGGSIISLRFASSQKKKQDRIQTSQVKKLQFHDTQSQNRAKQTNDSITKTPHMLRNYQQQHLVTSIIRIGSSHINDEELNDFISPDKKHRGNLFQHHNDAVETNSNNLSGIKMKVMQSKLKDSPEHFKSHQKLKLQSQSSPESGSGSFSNSSNSQSQTSESSTPTSGNMMTNQMPRNSYLIGEGYFTQIPYQQQMMAENPFAQQQQNYQGQQLQFHMQKGCHVTQLPMDPLLQNLVSFRQALHEQQQSDYINMIHNQQNGHAFHHTQNYADGESGDSKCKCALQQPTSLPESRQETSVKKTNNNSDLKTPESSPNKTNTGMTQYNYILQPTYKFCMHNCNTEQNQHLGLMPQQSFGFPPQMGPQFGGMNFCQHQQPQNMNMFQQPQWVNAYPQYQQQQFGAQYQNFPIQQTFQNPMDNQLQHNLQSHEYQGKKTGTKKDQKNLLGKHSKSSKHYTTGQQKQSKHEEGTQLSHQHSKREEKKRKKEDKIQIQTFQMPSNKNETIIETPQKRKIQKTDDVKLLSTVAGNNKLLINMTANGKAKYNKLSSEDKKNYMTPSVNDGPRNTPSDLDKIPDFNQNLRRFENTTNQKKISTSNVFDELSVKKKQSNTVQKPTRSVQDNSKPKSTRKTQEEKDKEQQIQNEQIQEKLKEILAQTISHDELKQKDRVTPQVGCKCKKSGCSKLYCECLQHNGYCGPECGCIKECCINIREKAEEREIAIEKILKQRIDAFEQKVKHASATNVHFKGCTCKRSQCQKKYCECFQHGVACTDSCKCNDCKNGKPHTHDDAQDQDEDGVSVEEDDQIEELVDHVPEIIIKHDNSHPREKGSEYDNGQESLSVVENSCVTPKKADYVLLDAEENKEASLTLNKNEILTHRQEELSSNCQHSVVKVQEIMDESQIPHIALKTKKASSTQRKTQITSQMRKSSRLQQKKQVAFIKENDQ